MKRLAKGKKANKPNANRLDIRSVAELAKVSIATVSRVINQNPKVDPKLAKRVRDAIGELGYVPNGQARALVSGKSNIFGVLISDITNPFFPELIQGFDDAAVKLGYEILIGATNYDLQKMNSCVERLLQRNVDGVAVMTFGIEEPLLDKLASRGVPMVFIDVAPATLKSIAIPIDYDNGISEAVQHLAVLGHRRIAFISGPVVATSAMARRKAFLDATKRIGISPTSEYVVVGDHTLEGGIEAAMKLAKLKTPPTAIMCSNDLTALGAMHALVGLGLSVPRDVSVIGFDDVRFNEFMLPPMTSVRMSRAEIAQAAVHSLKHLVEGKTYYKPQTIKTNLVVRQTTSIPAGALSDLYGDLAPRTKTSKRC